MNESDGNIKFLSAISYIGVLFVIGHFAVKKNNPDLRFHTFQGGILFAFFVLLYFIDFLIYLLLSAIPALQTVVVLLLSIGISVAYVMLMVMGIGYALKFQQRLLPFVGKTAVALRLALDNRSKNK